MDNGYESTRYWFIASKIVFDNQTFLIILITVFWVLKCLLTLLAWDKIYQSAMECIYAMLQPFQR